MKEYTAILKLVRERNPLVHQITNYVTVNDCANATICVGASPVMSHAVEDVADMVKIASALVLNIGTLDKNQIEGMLVAGGVAAKRGIPIILDPVGAGATPYRTETANHLLKELPITVLKGNAGEIGTIAGASAKVRGVDSESISGNKKDIVKNLAREYYCTVVMSGEEDIISDGERLAEVKNGVPFMGKVSGTGCMASAICGAFTAYSSDIMDGCITAMTYFGVAGEIAAKTAEGPGTFKPKLFDAMANLTIDEFKSMAEITEY